MAVTWRKKLMDAVSENDLQLAKSILEMRELREISKRRQILLERQYFLPFSVARGSMEMTKLMIESGFDVNSISRSTSYIGGYDAKFTSLHCAVYFEKVDRVKMLLDLGADANQRGTAGERRCSGTPLDWAKQLDGRCEIVGLLEEHAVLQSSFEALEPFEKLQQQKKKLSELANAKKTMEEIETKEVQAKQKQEKIEQTQNEVEKAAESLAIQKEQLAALEEDIKKLRSLPSIRYMNVTKKHLEEIENMRTTLEGAFPQVSSAFACSVCFHYSKQVFSCREWECGNWVCGDCRDRVVACPICRADLAVKPLRKDGTAEIMLEATLKEWLEASM